MTHEVTSQLEFFLETLVGRELDAVAPLGKRIDTIAITRLMGRLRSRLFIT